MEYIQIIENILNDTELIAQCEKKLATIEAKGESSTELIHVARYLSLDKIDYETKENASENFKELLSELDTLTKIDKANDTNDDTIVSLQLSSILDSVLQKLSNIDKKIYIYRYFYIHSIDTIANLCGCSSSNVTKTLSATNSKLLDKLHNSKIQCSAKTLLRSFADIDINYLNTTIGDNSTEKNERLKNNFSSSKGNSTLWKRILNLSLATLFVVSIIANLYLITDGFAPNKKTVNSDYKIQEETNKDTNEETKKETNEETTDKATDEATDEYNDLVRYIDGIKRVDTDKLFSYYDSDKGCKDNIYYETEHFISAYSHFPLEDSVPLEKCIGKEIPELQTENTNYYRLKGISAMDYIIQKIDDKYNLYNIYNISNREDLSEYPIGVEFSEILNGFYGISYDYDIKSITVEHTKTNDNFPDINAKKLFDNRKDISTLFNILNTSLCSNEINTLLSTNKRLDREHLSASSVCLYIETKDGTIIDSIYYSTRYHCFFTAGNYIAFMIPSEYNRNSYVDTMLGFDNHKVEPIDPANWNIDVSVHSANVSDIGITAKQTDSQTNGLYIGEEFVLEKYEDGKWTELPIIYGYKADEQGYFSTYVDTGNSVSTKSFDILDKYNRPTNEGKYRITIKIYDINSKDINNPSYREYSTEFEFIETNINIYTNSFN